MALKTKQTEKLIINFVRWPSRASSSLCDLENSIKPLLFYHLHENKEVNILLPQIPNIRAEGALDIHLIYTCLHLYMRCLERHVMRINATMTVLRFSEGVSNGFKKQRNKKSFTFFMDKFDLGLTFYFCSPGNLVKV